MAKSFGSGILATVLFLESVVLAPFARAQEREGSLPTQTQIRDYLSEVLSIYEADGTTPFSFGAHRGGALPKVMLVSNAPEIFPKEFVYFLVPTDGVSERGEKVPYVLSVHRRVGESEWASEPFTTSPIRLSFFEAKDPRAALSEELSAKLGFFKRLLKIAHSEREVKRVEKIALSADSRAYRALGAIVLLVGGVIGSLILQAGPGAGWVRTLAAGAIAMTAIGLVSAFGTAGSLEPTNPASAYVQVQEKFERRLEALGPLSDEENSELLRAFQVRLDTLVRGLPGGDGPWVDGPVRIEGVILAVGVTILSTLAALLVESRRSAAVVAVSGILGATIGTFAVRLAARRISTSDDIDAAVDAEFSRLLAGIRRRS